MISKMARTKKSGFVIVAVLCLTICLFALLLSFNHKSRANLWAVDDFSKAVQALNCARAGLNIAIAAIKTTPDIYANRKLLKLFSGEDVFTVGDGKCSVTITEENGKLNLNVLKNESGQLNRVRISQMLHLIDLLNRQHADDSHISYSLVPAIIDWTDDDEQVTYLPYVKRENLGAESDYYSHLEPPYQCKNRPLETIDEILPVKCMTPQLLNRIRDYVTVYGDGAININCAPALVIESLSEKMDAALARMIIERRETKPFESIAELRDVPGMTDGIYHTIKKTITVSPAQRYYQVSSQGEVNHLKSTIVAIFTRNTKTKNVEVVLYREL